MARINGAAKELDVSADWLRRLERAGRIPPARRDLNGHRRYSQKDIKQLRDVLFGSGVGEDDAGPAQRRKSERRARAAGS